jgi:hypothetical protein
LGIPPQTAGWVCLFGSRLRRWTGFPFLPCKWVKNGVKVTKLNTFVIKLGKEMASLRKLD